MNQGKIAVGLIALALLTGCTASPTGNPGKPVSVKPLSDYLPSESEVKLIRKAQGILVNACSAAYGLHTNVDGPLMDTLYEDIRKGVELPIPMRQAEKYGYHPAPPPPSSGAQDDTPPSTAEQEREKTTLLVLNGPAPGPRTSASRTPDQPVVVHGRAVPEGGCLRASEAELAKGGPDLDAHGAQGRDALNTMLWLRHQAETATTRHPAYLRMVRSWSACMKKAGHSYTAFEAAENDPEWRGEQAGEEEIAVATADVTCRVAVDFTGVTGRLRAEYDRQALSADPELVRAVEQHFRTVVRHAKEIAG